MDTDEIYYNAMLARDARFDGKFFVGVKTTGIYCRPICPARPKRENVEFFPHHLAAERAGYRPCMRCHPESAPMSPTWIGSSAIVQRAVKVLHTNQIIEFDENQFARLFGVTARHLRRLFVQEIGKTPKQLSMENRLNLARKLIRETALTMGAIAYASGFTSVRRFNQAFKDRFRVAPTAVRRSRVNPSNGIEITLPYRPPYDFDGLMQSYQRHRVGNLEWFSDGHMYRVVALNGQLGTIAVGHNPEAASLTLNIDFPDTSALHFIVSRVRDMFDLHSDPALVANALETDPAMKMLMKACPGVRLPSGWDPFEICVSAILGQLVSVERGRALVSQLINMAGTPTDMVANGEPVALFPSPEQIVRADLSSLKSTGQRKRTLVDFARAIVTGEISLEPTQCVDEFIGKVTALKGIGPWTAQYMALKALRSTDVFPASDLILARGLALHPPDMLAAMRPWRGYAAALMWRRYSGCLQKKNTNERKP